jgi:hypothetical protein
VSFEPLLAHQGNWDEAIMFFIPIVLAIAVVKLTEKRGAKKRAESGDDQED